MKCQSTPSKTPTKTPVKTPTKGTPNKKLKIEPVERRPWTCWADPATCPVHSSNAPRICWAFFSGEEDVTALISTLNKRGVRENILQATLEDEKDRVIHSIGKCPMSRLNPNLVIKHVLWFTKFGVFLIQYQNYFLLSGFDYYFWSIELVSKDKS